MKTWIGGKTVFWPALKGMDSHYMVEFETLWRFVMKRTERGVMTVQEQHELEHVFNLMRDCDARSYLEIGSAEGNSLYVMVQSMQYGARALSVNIEDHTKTARQEIVKLLGENWPVYQKTGDSTDPKTIEDVRGKWDCVLIDAAHDYQSVLSDALNYGPLAQKYIFFHDIQLPEVKRAVDEYAKQSDQTYTTFINSPTFGYAVFEIGKI